MADPLRRAVRYRTRLGRYSRHLESANSLGKARCWDCGPATTRRYVRGAISFQPAIAEAAADRDHRLHLRSRERNPVTSVERRLQRRSLRHFDPAGEEAHATATCGTTATASSDRAPTAGRPALPKPPLENVAPLTTIVHARNARRGARRDAGLVPLAFVLVLARGSSARTCLTSSISAEYFNYFPLQAPRRQALHQRDPPPAPRLRRRHAPRPRQRFPRRGRAAQRALPRRRQHDTARLRAEFARRRRCRGRPAWRRGHARHQQRAAFPLWWIVDGVAFVDVGNVFPHVNDFSLSDMREAAGLGLRLRTPWFLVRVDYGVPLGPPPRRIRGAAPSSASARPF